MAVASGGKGWPTARGTIHCAVCQRQTSLAAGTILHNTRVPLRGRLLAMWLACTQKAGLTLLQAEEGHACPKGSLGLRPNHHQPEERVEAHIFITVPAYHLLCRVREKLRASRDVRDWETLRRLPSTHSLATTRLPLEDRRVLHIRKATVPDAAQAGVYRKLGIDWKGESPMQKRFVES